MNNDDINYYLTKVGKRQGRVRWRNRRSSTCAPDQERSAIGDHRKPNEDMGEVDREGGWDMESWKNSVPFVERNIATCSVIAQEATRNELSSPTTITPTSPPELCTVPTKK